MIRLIFVGILSVLSTHSFAAGLAGVPGSVSGKNDGDVQAINDIDSGTKRAVNFAREAVIGEFESVRPVRDTGRGVTPVGSGNSSSANEDPLVLAPEVIEERRTQRRTAPARKVEFEIPPEYTFVPKNNLGTAFINGDKDGTYLIKAPSMLFSRIELPFSPKVVTPFPSLVVTQVHGNVILFAPTQMAPVNLIIYHPDQPLVSVSIVILPDANEIPATVKISFAKERIPEAVIEHDKIGEMIGEHRVSTIAKGNSSDVAHYERTSSHLEFLKKINIDLARGVVPDGYSLRVVTDGPIGVLCGDRRLVGAYSQNIVGENFEIDVFQVRNASDDYVTFKERSCYRGGVVSVLFNPSPTIKPGENAELIIIHSRKNNEKQDVIKRPSLVGAK